MACTPLGLTCTLRSTEKVLVRPQLLEQLNCSAFGGSDPEDLQSFLLPSAFRTGLLLHGQAMVLQT